MLDRRCNRDFRMFLLLSILSLLSGCGGGGVSDVTYRISGQITLGGAPLAGVTVNLTGAKEAQATTDAAGSYSLAGLANGPYAVSPVRTGYAFSPGNADVVISDNNATRDFTASGTPAIAAGVYYSLALKSDGTVWAWGSNARGQLGDGTTADRPSPGQVTGLAAVTAIAAGGRHALALKSDGTVWAWGANEMGQIGDNTITDRSTPVQVVGLSGATAISAGQLHSLALTSEGGVKEWGLTGAVSSPGGSMVHHIPADVVGLTTGVASISAGNYFSLALTGGGDVKAWGANGDGQLGDGTTATRYIPVDVIGLASGVTAVSAGLSHSLALTGAGGVKAWGSNGDGELGNGSTTPAYIPFDVSTLASGVTAIAAGNYVSLALTEGGGMKAWGLNSDGQIGDGTTTTRYTPVDIGGLSSGVTAIAAGYYHSLALTGSGDVKAWGLNSDGQIGDGTTTSRLTPVDVNF